MHFMKEIDAAGGTSTGLNFVTALSLAAKHRYELASFNEERILRAKINIFIYDIYSQI